MAAWRHGAWGMGSGNRRLGSGLGSAFGGWGLGWRCEVVKGQARGVATMATLRCSGQRTQCLHAHTVLVCDNSIG